MSIYDNYAVGIDVSIHNKPITIKKGDIDFLISRIGGTDSTRLYLDITFSADCQKAYDADIPFIGYWFVCPGYWLGKQYTTQGVTNLTNDQHPIYQAILNSVAPVNTATGKRFFRAIHGLYFDLEDQSLSTTSGQVTTTWLEFYVEDLRNRLASAMARGEIPTFRTGVYSRTGWMKQYAPSLGVHLGNHPEMGIWPAQWISGPRVTVPLAEVRKYIPGDNYKCAGFGWTDKRVNPSDWTIWQVSGDAPGSQVIKLTETGGAVDVDIFHGTVEQLHAYFKYTPRGVTPPVVVEPPVVEPPVVVPPTITIETVNAKIDALIARWDKVFK